MRMRNYTVPLLAILASIGIVIVLFATRWGIGISPDSTTYIGVARNLVQGRGLSENIAGGGTKPLTHFPPLFPSLLAGGGLLGVEPLDGARWLNAILFGANILLGGLVVRLYTRGSVAPALFASFVLLASFDMLQIHSMAWTEPVFIFFGVLGLALLAAYVDGRTTLAAASAAMALAFLARYSGVAFVVAGIAGILLLGRKPLPKRIADALIFGLIGCGPMALWMTGNVLATGAPTSRHIAFHPVTHAHWQQAVMTVSLWLLPGRSRGFLVLIALVVTAVLSALPPWFGKPPSPEGDPARPHLTRLPALLALFIVVYLGFLAVAISFADPETAFDQRQLSPVYVSGILLGLCVAAGFSRPLTRVRVIQSAAVVLCLTSLALSLVRLPRFIASAHRDGLEYAAREWRQSPLVGYIRALPSGMRIYSNGPDAIYILTGRTTYPIPARGRRTHPAEMAAMRRELENGNAVLIYFAAITWRPDLLSEAELKAALPLRLIGRAPDGSIYGMER